MINETNRDVKGIVCTPERMEKWHGDFYVPVAGTGRPETGDFF